MRKMVLWQYTLLTCVAMSSLQGIATAQQPSSTKFAYPESKKSDQVDEYHGVQVSDSYRWLEDVDSDATRKWVQAQNDVTFKYLKGIPERDGIAKRLTEVWNYERYGFPVHTGNWWIYSHNNGLQNQSVLYKSKELDAEKFVLLDPNQLSDDGTVALTDFKASSDGKYLAYGLANSGSDWNTWRIRDIESGEDLADRLEWVKFSSIAWTKDSKGFFYSRYDQPTNEAEFTGVNYFQKLYYHQVGTDQSEDILVYDRPDQKEWGFTPEVSDDGTYLIISVWRGTERKQQIFISAIQHDVVPSRDSIRGLIEGFEADYTFLGNDQDRLYFETDLDAPMRRIVAVPIADASDRQKWETVVPEQTESIEQSALLGDQFHVCYLKDATSVVKRFAIDGKPLPDLSVPELGTVTGFQTKRSESTTFYSFTNYITPPTIFKLDLKTGQSTIFRKPDVSFDSNDFVTERRFYTSKDGTRIPLILSYKKGFVADGSARAFLYAYGGFNISITPNFSPSNLVWMEQGGVYAVANLRGGGEYGRGWHEAGMLDRKQNVFDDFISAAEYLVAEKITTPNRLAIHGRSNGGLLIGAVMTQRPDLAAVALPAVGVLDMLRFQKFTIGWAWVSEFGSSDDEEQFKYLLEYSPLHNLKAETAYPATMITTGDHDDRVVPGHSFKFAAALQKANNSDAPMLIRIETSAGHGAGTPISKLVEAASDMWAFVIDNTR